MRLAAIALAAVTGLSSAWAEPLARGYIIEADTAHLGAAQDLARQYDGRGQYVFPSGLEIYVAPATDEAKRLEDLYQTQLDPRLRSESARGLHVRRFDAPFSSVFAPDARSRLTAEEERDLARLEARLGGEAQVLRPTTEAAFTQAFNGERSFELPLPDGVIRRFEPSRAQLPSQHGARFYSGETQLEDGSRARLELVGLEGDVAGRLVSEAGAFELRRVGQFAYAWVGLSEPMRQPPPDHPYDAYDRFVTASAPSGVTGGAQRLSAPLVCPTREGRQLDVLFYYTPAAASAALRQFSAELDRPMVEFANALQRSDITNVEVTIPSVALPLTRYTEDVGTSACLEVGECEKPWSRHLAAFMARTDVAAERARRRADIVVLVVADAGSCGLVPDAAVTTGTTRDTAYAVVALTCLAGRATLAHELGHLLGSRHDSDVNSSDTSFAWSRQGVRDGWASIGAVSCFQQTPPSNSWQDRCSRNLHEWPRFADPSIVPTGEPLRDHRNERDAIRAMAPCVAGFGETF